MAIGMPGKTVSGKQNAGAILVTFGSAHGLTGKHVYITQNSANVPGTPGYQDYFGSSLASGDMNRDGYADLLVGSEGDGSGNGSVTGSAQTSLYRGSSTSSVRAGVKARAISRGDNGVEGVSGCVVITSSERGRGVRCSRRTAGSPAGCGHRRRLAVRLRPARR
ncbi:FG-GAP repeat protein [Streptomyces olivaceoviridis]|uniref:FG-GAP repeat protein n=1 Tax=Streptomyces olivaceoviridis TaxID=1921 RepID=UPI001E4629C6|nr:FG-GAP repeat protein [Streptomyces olivaceoviridis]